MPESGERASWEKVASPRERRCRDAPAAHRSWGNTQVSCPGTLAMRDDQPYRAWPTYRPLRTEVRHCAPCFRRHRECSLPLLCGSPLPFTFQSGTSSLTVTKDVLTVGSNASWTESARYSLTVSGQTTSGTIAEGGTWSRAGKAVECDSQASEDVAYSGTFARRLPMER